MRTTPEATPDCPEPHGHAKTDARVSGHIGRVAPLDTTIGDTRTEVAKGVRDSLSVGLGIFPLGIALGMLVVSASLPWWTAVLLPVLVFAGSVELLLVSLMSSGAALLTIAVTVLAVNFRHVFYAFSFPLQRVPRGPLRWYSMFAMTDEAYATYATQRPEALSGSRIVAMQAACHLYWVVGSVVGLLIASLVSAPLRGFEFALFALFSVMFLDAFRGREQVPSILLSGLSATAALVFVPDQPIPAALFLFVGLLTLRFFWVRSRHGGDA